MRQEAPGLRVGDRVRAWFELARSTWREFSGDNGSLVAAAVSFYVFLSLFPLLLAAVGILGLVYGPPSRAENLVLSATKGFTVGTEVRQLVHNVVVGGAPATGIGLLIFLWSGSTAVVMLERAMNIAFGVRRQRGYVKRRLVALLLIVLAGVLLIASIAATAFARYLQRVSPSIISGWSWTATLLSYVVPLFVIIGVFTLVYRILPNTEVRWRTALIGGVFAGVLWEIALQAFAFYVSRYASYDQVYGSLGAVILLMVWIDYSSIIAILGAELAALIQGRSPERNAQQAPST